MWKELVLFIALQTVFGPKLGPKHHPNRLRVRATGEFAQAVHST